MLLLLLACAEPEVVMESLDLPADQAAAGVPVGVQTVTKGDVTFEVWYPASDASAEVAASAVDFMQFIPASFSEAVGDFSLPALPSVAVRDADVRNTGEAMPLVLFSHGFGGTRLQSVSLTEHLASRGYVVIAPDHPGRMMGDVLPCLFAPPLDGCDMTGFFEDPAIEDLTVALDWALSEQDWLLLDDARIGLAGHSAGGSSTTSLGEVDDRIGALLPMAGAGAVSRDVPTLVIDGTCDGIVSTASTQQAAEASTSADIAHIAGAGHLAFADLCTLELDQLAADLLEGRDDLNAALYDQLLALGTDGCPGAAPAVSSADCTDSYLDFDTSAEIIRYGATAFFDAQLLGSGEVSFAPYPDVY